MTRLRLLEKCTIAARLENMKLSFALLLSLAFPACANQAIEKASPYLEWEGEYFFGSGGPGHHFLYLRSDGTYESIRGSCDGMAAAEQGKWLVAEEMIEFVPSKSRLSNSMKDQSYHLIVDEQIHFIVSPRLWFPEITQAWLLGGGYIRKSDVIERKLWRRGWPYWEGLGPEDIFVNKAL